MLRMPKPEDIVTIDFETFYDKDYTLAGKSMNMSEYVRDERFHVHCAALKVGTGPTQVYSGEDIGAALAAIDWRGKFVLAHNTAFDGFILSHHFNVHPYGYLDTLSMSRAFFGHAHKHDLGSVAARCGIGRKNAQALHDTKGILDLSDEEYAALATYCGNDVDLCRGIFDYLYRFFPDKEIALIDVTLRMFCDPILKVDQQRAHEEYAKECGKKAAALFKTGVSAEDLVSNDKFAELLRREGIDVPTKISKTTKKVTHAFAKGDLGFQAIRSHSTRASDLVEARLALKSTIGETRAHRLIEAGRDGLSLPVLLNYYGAHTGRWSGGNKLNLQNLPRGGELRRSILAPEGHVIVVADSAQIEARTLAWLAGQSDLVALFASGQDVYKHMASKIYGVPLDKVTKEQRFIGKTCVLGLGYGMGAKKLHHSLITGVMGPKVDISLSECQRIVNIYRQANAKIVEFWSLMNAWLSFMIVGKRDELLNGAIYTRKNSLMLPNGIPLHYTGMKAEEVQQSPFGWGEEAAEVSYLTNKGYSKIYGGLLAENLVQALSRCIVAEQMLTISERYRVVMMTHDEVVNVAPEKEAEHSLAYSIDVMRTPPNWAEGLPLNAEGGYDHCYSK